MSSINVFVGQCGNQLARTYFELIELNETNTQTANLYKHFDGKYRSIHLDSEIKVINSLSSTFGTKLRKENIIKAKHGRGNNWASGFMGLKHDGCLNLIEHTMDAVRREAEKCDFLLNFNMFHSLSGGTGSGTGSALMQSLRDVYGSKKCVYSIAIAPFSSGEAPLQSYNNLLCMSYLHEMTDCVILFQNDDISNIIEKYHNKNSTKSNDNMISDAKKNLNEQELIKKININDLNSYIMRSYVSTILPIDGISMKKQSIGLEFYELERLLCSNKNLKIIELYNFKENSKNFFVNKLKTNQLLKEQLLPYVKLRNLNENRLYTTINSIFMTRGTDLSDSFSLFQNMENDLKKSFNCVTWNPYTIDYWTTKAPLVLASNHLNNKKSQPKQLQTLSHSSITLALNRNYCNDYLCDIKLKSILKYKARAYLHWYEKYGVDKEYFESAFENIDFIIDCYNEMTRV